MAAEHLDMGMRELDWPFDDSGSGEDGAEAVDFMALKRSADEDGTGST